MRYVGTALTIALVAILLAPMAGAGELVLFRDGRYLRVESHATGVETIRLQLGANAWLVVPQSRIDWIEKGGHRVRFDEPAVGEEARGDDPGTGRRLGNTRSTAPRSPGSSANAVMAAVRP